MANPRDISTLILQEGPGCFMSKLDQKNAYKNIGVTPTQYRLQGFSWLGRYFVEICLIFGSAAAPSQYDTVSGAFTSVVRALSQTKRSNLKRALDDQVCISKCLHDNKKFVTKYIETAKEINLPLADPSDPEKTFLYQTKGKILGVVFCTKTMTWSFDERKINKFMFCLQETKNRPVCSLRQLQRSLGVIESILLLTPILKCFKTPVIRDLKRAYKKSPIVLSSQTIFNIHGWLHALEALKSGFPLVDIHEKPPEDSLCLIADAAGLANGDKMSHNIGVGVAIFVKSTEDIFVACSERWDNKFIQSSFDDKDKFIGNKSTTLETLGVILALFHAAKNAQNNHVILQCDNIAVIYALLNGRSKTDSWADMFISALLFVSISLQCKIWPQHCPRLSSKPAVVADLLSRDDEKGRKFVSHLHIPVLKGWPPCISDWMKNPRLDDNFRFNLLRDFRAKLQGIKVATLRAKVKHGLRWLPLFFWHRGSTELPPRN